MATSEPVYNSTTTAAPRINRWFVVPTAELSKPRCYIKILEVVLSLVAFVLEELVENCISCGPLYYFEFVSCTAFLFTLLLLILLSTTLQWKVGITCWPTLDFVYTALITVLFFIASIAFSISNEGTKLEITMMAFGFLASLAFLIDLAIFIKTKGFPRPNIKKAPKNSSPPVPESEKLNANGSN